jgi:hypothetical protein
MHASNMKKNFFNDQNIDLTIGCRFGNIIMSVDFMTREALVRMQPDGRSRGSHWGRTRARASHGLTIDSARRAEASPAAWSSALARAYVCTVGTRL